MVRTQDIWTPPSLVTFSLFSIPAVLLCGPDDCRFQQAVGTQRKLVQKYYAAADEAGSVQTPARTLASEDRREFIANLESPKAEYYIEIMDRVTGIPRRPSLMIMHQRNDSNI